MSMLVVKKVLGRVLKVMQLSRSRWQHSCVHNKLSILSHFPSDKRGVAREQIDPKTQGPTNISEILKDVLDMSQKCLCSLQKL